MCPVCSEKLERGDKSYACKNGHMYDIAKEGYVNLINANMKHSLSPGDDKQMAKARRDFLSRGYYKILLDALCSAVCEVLPDISTVLDAGCGEGYYTGGIYRALTRNGKRTAMVGTDISKHILKYAAKSIPEVEFAVASSYRLPLERECVNAVVNCFSPLALDEFLRVLKPGGAFVYVVPGAEHLWGLKKILYNEPYKNQEKITPYPGFEYVDIIKTSEKITLTDKGAILSLFGMTPYYWKTSKEGVERLKKADTVSTDIAFNIHIFRKQK